MAITYIKIENMSTRKNCSFLSWGFTRVMFHSHCIFKIILVLVFTALPILRRPINLQIHFTDSNRHGKPKKYSLEYSLAQFKKLTTCQLAKTV